VQLLRRHEPDDAVAILMDVPVHDCCCQLVGLFFAGKGLAGPVQSVFDGADTDPGGGSRR